MRSTVLGDLEFLFLSVRNNFWGQASIAEESVALPLGSFLSEARAVLSLCLLALFFIQL